MNQTLDVALRAGKYARRPPLPHMPGSDAAGEVAAVAPDVKKLKVGDRVVCHPIVGRQPNGAPKLLGVDTSGTYAEFVKVPASTVQIVPDALDFVTAAVVGGMARWPSHSCATAPRSSPANGFWSWERPAAWAARWCKRRSISARASSRRPAATRALTPPSNWARTRESITAART